MKVGTGLQTAYEPSAVSWQGSAKTWATMETSKLWAALPCLQGSSERDTGVTKLAGDFLLPSSWQRTLLSQSDRNFDAISQSVSVNYLGKAYLFFLNKNNATALL